MSDDGTHAPILFSSNRIGEMSENSKENPYSRGKYRTSR